MSDQISPKERMTAAFENQCLDHVPLSFMIFTALRTQCKDHFEFVEKQLELGLDAMVELRFLPMFDKRDLAEITGLPIRFDPAVTVREWSEQPPGEPYPILHKEYSTPAGTLTSVVQKSEDWPHGDYVPFIDDYLIPRAKQLLVSSHEDLKALEYLLRAPFPEDIVKFKDYAAEARKFADRHQLLLSGGWGASMEVGGWLCGIQDLMFLAFDQPDFVLELADIFTRWNHSRMEIMLEAGVDIFIRRGWYENASFWSPDLYRKFLLPGLCRDVELAHQAGAKFAYIVTSSTMPLIPLFIEAGVDVLVGVDPVQGVDTDLKAIKEAAAGKICLQGGVNGFVTIEQGTTEEVREATAEAMRVMSPGGGFILSPVDNVRDTSEKARENVLALIATWKELRD